MKFHVFTIRDSAADTFGVPMFMASKGQAIRSFADEVNRVDPNNMLNKHPQDFELYYLGTYDGDTASFKQEEYPESVVRGADCLTKVQ
jgi:hypothetical protein